ncbi:hypothetical protein [Microcystis phage MaeS]|nr:hypothetical protein [Microcystis phage MaeS]
MVRDKRTEINNLQGDIWTDDDDALLAETILRNVREGKTVMDGCRQMEEVTEGRRTASASKYRWFTRLVEQYKAGYELAKSKGKEVKEAKKRKTNKGERYREIIETVLDVEEDRIEKELDIDDLIILANKIKQQQSQKGSNLNKLEKELNKEKKLRMDAEKEVKKLKNEVNELTELLRIRKEEYDKVIESLSVLKKLGVPIELPKPNKYTVGKGGVIDLVESP